MPSSLGQSQSFCPLVSAQSPNLTYMSSLGSGCGHDKGAENFFVPVYHRCDTAPTSRETGSQQGLSPRLKFPPKTFLMNNPRARRENLEKMDGCSEKPVGFVRGNQGRAGLASFGETAARRGLGFVRGNRRAARGWVRSGKTRISGSGPFKETVSDVQGPVTGRACGRHAAFQKLSRSGTVSAPETERTIGVVGRKVGTRRQPWAHPRTAGGGHSGPATFSAGFRSFMTSATAVSSWRSWPTRLSSGVFSTVTSGFTPVFSMFVRAPSAR